jgi:cell division protein FtsN
MILVFFSALCFAQQTPRITGVHPDPASNNRYRLQVGAYTKTANAASAFAKLKRAGFTPAKEPYKNLTRVFIAGVKAKDVKSYTRRIAALGFREIYITKETAVKQAPVVRKLVRDPIRITGIRPDPASNNRYRLQVGAFPVSSDAAKAFTLLKDAGFTPSKEQYKNLTRVFIAGVKAKDVNSYTRRIAELGFREVYITEDTGAAIREAPSLSKPVVVAPVAVVPPKKEAEPKKTPADSKPVVVEPLPAEETAKTETPPVKKPVITFSQDEKWNIVFRDSRYISFEFTGDSHYIGVEASDDPASDAPKVYFGEYTMRGSDTIDLTGFGKVTLNSTDKEVIQFTFEDTAYSAKKAEPITVPAKTNLFFGTWKLQQINGEEVSGTEDELTVLYSKAGTYLVSYPDGEVELAQWKWKDDAENEFLYSFHDWKCYGSAKINRSSRTALAFEDSGYDFSIDGYSTGDVVSSYLFVPFKN